MARRIELQGIARDLLLNFVSRNNDLGGYWSLGLFQKYLSENATNKLSFDLLGEQFHPVFPQTTRVYRNAFLQNLKKRGISANWVNECTISVKQSKPSLLECGIQIETDLGRVFTSRRSSGTVRPHDYRLELRSTRYIPVKNHCER